jgi:hypothetical protein
LLKNPKDRERLEIFAQPPTVAGMITILSTVVSILGFRLRRRAFALIVKPKTRVNDYRLRSNVRAGI